MFRQQEVFPFDASIPFKFVVFSTTEEGKANSFYAVNTENGKLFSAELFTSNHVFNASAEKVFSICNVVKRQDGNSLRSRHVKVEKGWKQIIVTISTDESNVFTVDISDRMMGEMLVDAIIEKRVEFCGGDSLMINVGVTYDLPHCDNKYQGIAKITLYKYDSQHIFTTVKTSEYISQCQSQSQPRSYEFAKCSREDIMASVRELMCSELNKRDAKIASLELKLANVESKLNSVHRSQIAISQQKYVPSYVFDSFRDSVKDLKITNNLLVRKYLEKLENYETLVQTVKTIMRTGFLIDLIKEKEPSNEDTIKHLSIFSETGQIDFNETDDIDKVLDGKEMVEFTDNFVLTVDVEKLGQLVVDSIKDLINESNVSDEHMDSLKSYLTINDDSNNDTEDIEDTDDSGPNSIIKGLIEGFDIVSSMLSGEVRKTVKPANMGGMTKEEAMLLAMLTGQVGGAGGGEMQDIMSLLMSGMMGKEMCGKHDCKHIHKHIGPRVEEVDSDGNVIEEVEVA